MTDAILEAYLERVAIMIHDGNVPEHDAVKQAYYEIKRLYAVKVMPERATRELREIVNKVLNGGQVEPTESSTD